MMAWVAGPSDSLQKRSSTFDGLLELMERIADSQWFDLTETGVTTSEVWESLRPLLPKTQARIAPQGTHHRRGSPVARPFESHLRIQVDRDFLRPQ